VDCINKMKTNNLDTYKLIVMNMNEEQKTKLTHLMKETFQVEGKKRVIRKVVGIKSQAENANEVENENSDLEEESEYRNFKRQRVMQKKKEGKRNKINVE
jgi:hypothetical protein